MDNEINPKESLIEQYSQPEMSFPVIKHNDADPRKFVWAFEIYLPTSVSGIVKIDVGLGSVLIETIETKSNRSGIGKGLSF